MESTLPTEEPVPTEPALASLSDRVRELRGIHHWTQADLARRTGLSRAYINAIEAGSARDPSGKTLGALARALDVHVVDLLQAARALPHDYQQSQIQTELDLTMYLRRQRKLSEGFVSMLVQLIRLGEMDEKPTPEPDDTLNSGVRQSSGKETG